MNNSQEYFRKIIEDISFLYELALVVGQSLDLEKNCAHFLTRLMGRKSLSYSAVFIQSHYLQSANDPKSYQLIHSIPSSYPLSDIIQEDHPILKNLGERDYVVAQHPDPLFAQFIQEKKINQGVYVVFALGKLGFLKLYSQLARETFFTPQELYKIKKVISKFTISLQGCIYHLHLKREIKERRLAEALRNNENHVLTLIGKGRNLQEIYQSIIYLLEEHNPSCRASLFLYEGEEGRFSTPKKIGVFSQNIRVTPPWLSPCQSPQKEVIFFPSLTSPLSLQRQEAFVEELQQAGFLSCWSQDILSVSGNLLGTAVIYSKDAGPVDSSHLQVLDWSTRIVSIAIEGRQSQEALKRSEQKNISIVRAIPDTIIRFNQEGLYLDIVTSSPHFFFQDLDDIIGRNIKDILPDDLGEEILLAIEESLVKNRLCQLECQMKVPAGKLWFEIRIVPGKHDEVIAFFRDITEKKDSEEKIAAYTRRLEESKKEIEMTMEEVNRMAIEAEIATIAKDQFMATMSHEIRTPMNVIMGMADLLSQSPLNREQQEFIGMIKESANSLLSLINDILDLSKIESGNITLEETSFHLIDEVEKTVSLFAQKAHEKNLELICHIKKDVPVLVKGDEIRMKQILVNLIGNAIKFTPKGEVLVTLAREEGLPSSTERVFFRFSVKDTGIGIPDNKRHLLFQRFTQLDGSISRKYGGTGLGLAITKKLVKIMGGTLTVESQEGEGSTFIATIPLLLLEKKTRDSLSIPDFTGLRVLIIDSTLSTQLILDERLNDWGFWVQRGSDVKEGLLLFQEALKKETPFHLLLVDEGLSDTNGFQLIEKLKETDPPGTFMMMLSSHHLQEKIAYCRKIGVDHYFIKPIRVSDLYNNMVRLFFPSMDEEESQSTAFKGEKRGIAPYDIRILLVEDNPMNQRLTSAILKNRGYLFTIVNNGREALEHLEEDSFDVILMDVQMPVMDGFEKTRRIRKLEEGTKGHIPIIAMTAHAMKGDREKCIQAGMDDYVSKPIDVNRLYATVERLVEGSPQRERVEPVIDLDSMLSQMGGDKDLLAEVVEIFVQDVSQDISRLKEAIDARDWLEVKRLAHGLKGVLGNMGVKRYYRKALALEEASGKEDEDLVFRIFQELSLGIDEMLVFFHEEKKRGSQGE